MGDRITTRIIKKAEREGDSWLRLWFVEGLLPSVVPPKGEDPYDYRIPYGSFRQALQDSKFNLLATGLVGAVTEWIEPPKRIWCISKILHQPQPLDPHLKGPAVYTLLAEGIGMFRLSYTVEIHDGKLQISIPKDGHPHPPITINQVFDTSKGSHRLIGNATLDPTPPWPWWAIAVFDSHRVDIRDTSCALMPPDTKGRLELGTIPPEPLYAGHPDYKGTLTLTQIYLSEHEGDTPPCPDCDTEMVAVPIGPADDRNIVCIGQVCPNCKEVKNTVARAERSFIAHHSTSAKHYLEACQLVGETWKWTPAGNRLEWPVRFPVDKPAQGKFVLCRQNTWLGLVVDYETDRQEMEVCGWPWDFSVPTAETLIGEARTQAGLIEVPVKSEK